MDQVGPRSFKLRPFILYTYLLSTLDPKLMWHVMRKALQFRLHWQKSEGQDTVLHPRYVSPPYSATIYMVPQRISNNRFATYKCLESIVHQ